MAEQNLLPSSSSIETNSQNPKRSISIICDYPEDEEEETIPISYLPVQQPSLLYNQQSTNSEAQFNEDDDEQTSAFLLDLNLSTSVPIQRVSSEDELNFYAKQKRAKFIGPYLFGDVIGQGSYAKVKECLDRRNLCRRAVKIMQRRRLRKTPHGEQMAATEIRLLKKLKHPNVIQLYDFIRNDEKQKLYLFIDLCVVSLQEMIDNNEKQQQLKSFPIWQAHSYFIQLIAGLEYLHSNFIIHNDIKPGNLLITVDHQLKITDFGTAEQLDMFSPDDTVTRSQGTPAFQCPEIANGEDTYNGFAIDIWACGVTLYNLVTGRLPFEADNIYLLFQATGKGIFTIPDDIEPQLALLINGLLHINKHLRFTVEQIKQHDWFRRRPSRTYEFIPFPPLALNRFESFTMYDYITDLHQSSIKSEEDQQNGTTSVFISPTEEQTNHRTTLNCTCSQAISGENIIPQTKRRNKNQPKICSLS